LKPLDISLQPDNPPPVAVVKLAGFLDAHTVTDFDARMENFLDQKRTQVVLDIGDLNYISSAGIGAMMGLAHRLRKMEGKLILLKPSDKVFKILDTLGFTKIFQITHDESEAKKAVQAAG